MTKGELFKLLEPLPDETQISIIGFSSTEVFNVLQITFIEELGKPVISILINH